MVKYEDTYIGMRVMTNTETINDGLELPIGTTGTVCDFNDFGQCGVEFDTEHHRLHDCCGTCKNKHGWYTNTELLDPIQELPDLDVGDDIALF